MVGAALGEGDAAGSGVSAAVTRVDGAGGVETHRGGHAGEGGLGAVAEGEDVVGRRDRGAGTSKVAVKVPV